MLIARLPEFWPLDIEVDVRAVRTVAWVLLIHWPSYNGRLRVTSETATRQQLNDPYLYCAYYNGEEQRGD
jgi:hypothetical protein